MTTGYGYDQRRALLVAIRGKGESDAEYEEFLAHTEHLDRAAYGSNQDPVCIAIIKPDAPIPNARWRRRFAESSENGLSVRPFAGIVTQSAITRGVLNAIRWLQPTDRKSTNAYATFEVACAAAERFRGEHLPELRRLLAQAIAALDTIHCKPRAHASPLHL